MDVQAGGRLVQDVEGAAGLAFGKLLGKFDAPSFAAGKRDRGLCRDAGKRSSKSQFDYIRQNSQNIQKAQERPQQDEEENAVGNSAQSFKAKRVSTIRNRRGEAPIQSARPKPRTGLESFSTA